MMHLLPPLPVAGPLAVAALLLATSRLLPARVPDTVALLTVLLATAACVAMAVGTAATPLTYWFGGWTPRDGLVLGVGFVVDQPGAALAAFIGLLFAATLVFAWGYYDEVHAHFHVLMLLFLAGMIGFCLTHDLFNLFVWFELISVAAFALTGYQLRQSALEAALNFTVVNTLGSYLMLAGIGLLYARIGALDFTGLGRGVAAHPGDVVVAAAFTLLASGLLIKGAQVPFHFWLADAHAVAPSPVSVVFSGAMVALGVFGVGRLTWTVFADSLPVHAVVHALLLGLGCASAVVGGLMALAQRHLKRLLAFSTISHTGILLAGLALLRQDATAGMLAYLVGHGLVKAALFMLAGILLALCGAIDEITLRGQGRALWPVGIAFGAGGLLLAGLPFGILQHGLGLIDAAAHAEGRGWVGPVLTVGTALTGAAVLRAGGRIFLNLGPDPGFESRAPTEADREKADRPLWLMLAPPAVMLLAAVVSGGPAAGFAMRAAGQAMQPDSAHILGGPSLPPTPFPAEPPGTGLAWISVAVAIALAGLLLMRHRLPRRALALNDRVSDAVVGSMARLHTGRIGDYVTWMVFGLALFVVSFVLT
ncbi:MAG: NADH-quinone oxidoreductase subunit E [Rhodospirillales bacterium]|nr:NADH-quinone oxidoreductase subunit E [Rhodospirillales bacterium]